MNKLFILPIALTLSLFSCEKSKVLSQDKAPKVEIAYNPGDYEATEAQGIADAKKDFANGNFVKVYMGMPRDRGYMKSMTKMQEMLQKDGITLQFGDDIMTAYKSGYIQTMNPLLNEKFTAEYFDKAREKADAEVETEIEQAYKKYLKDNPTSKISKEEFLMQHF